MPLYKNDAKRVPKLQGLWMRYEYFHVCDFLTATFKTAKYSLIRDFFEPNRTLIFSSSRYRLFAIWMPLIQIWMAESKSLLCVLEIRTRVILCPTCIDDFNHINHIDAPARLIFVFSLFLAGSNPIHKNAVRTAFDSWHRPINLRIL